MNVNCLFFFFIIAINCGIPYGFCQHGLYRVKNFTEISRSLESQVNTIHQDEQGFMWFGSYLTLARFDGVHIKKFLEVDDSLMRWIGQIRKIKAGEKNKIWIMMSGGIINFDLKTGIFQTYNLDEAIRNKINFIDNRNYYNTIFPEGDILWIGTKQALIEFDIRHQKLAGIYQMEAENPGLVNDIRDIIPYDEQHLWIATTNCIYKFNKKVKSFSDDILENIPKKNADLRVGRGPSGRLWIGYGGDLYRYDPSRDSLRIEIPDFAEYITGHDFDDQQIFSNDSISWHPRTRIGPVTVMNDHQLLVAIRGHLIEYNHLTKTFRIISETVPDDRPWAVLDLSIDPDRSIWFSLESNGIFCAYPDDQPVHFLRDAINGTKGVLSAAYNIDVFDNGEVWVERSNGRGLARIDLASNSIQEYQADGLGHAITRRCVRDVNGILWAIADGGMIYSLDPVKAQYRYFHCPDTLSRRLHWYFTMALDGLGHVWAGGAGSGLVRMDMKTGNYEVFDRKYSNSNGFDLMSVWQILKIDKGSFLILGVREMIRLDITERVENDGSKGFAYHFSRYLDKNYEEIFDQLASRFVCGFLDSRGRLWLGTDGNGAVSYSSHSNIYQYYNQDNGLASNTISGIIEDNTGKIWFTTGKGLSRLDPASGKLENVFAWEDSDYPDYLFDWWDVHIDPQGHLYFGVLEDPIYLDPADFSDSSLKEKKMVLSDLKINNISQEADMNGRFPYLINYLDEIRLNYRDHLFSIDYGVLDYIDTEKYSYRYMMKGFDTDWIEAGPNTFLTYSNLPAGDYTLVLNYSTSRFFDEKNVVSLGVIKNPAPWNTWWAWLGYVLFFLATGGSMILLVIKRKRIRMELLEEHKQLEKIREIEEAKTRFFTQISHEIRTPLSLILQPVETLIQGEMKGKETKLYGMIRRNARRLKDLMDQMIDFSRIESGKLTLKVGQYDIVEFLRLIVANFSSLAESKKINFDFLPGITGSLMVSFDPDQMEKVMNNLIDNALKFTPGGGRVSIRIEFFGRNDPDIGNIPGFPDFRALSDKELVIISVKDTGIGIPPHLHERIFNRFDRGYMDNNHEFEGMGLGLSISKELVEQHQGKIWVEKNSDSGSVFYVVLPVEKGRTEESFKTRKPGTAIEKGRNLPWVEEKEEQEAILNDVQGKSSILFIEDNADMRRFVRTFLEPEFCVFEAGDGKKGLSIAIEKIPDIIVSDIMMPGMDGVQVVKNLKSDWRTCHIPVILLTARAGKGDKVNALKTGADDYIVKPFDTNELLYRIRNQLNQLDRLRERSIRNFLLKDPHASFNSRDAEFISVLAKIVKKHLEDPAFSVTELYHEMGVSRTQLFRKLKALTGKQPNEFIRCIRIKKAAELLKAGSATITEIAYDTGFSSISYFSRCFKEIFQVTPSEYIKNPSH